MTSTICFNLADVRLRDEEPRTSAAAARGVQLAKLLIINELPYVKTVILGYSYCGSTVAGASRSASLSASLAPSAVSDAETSTGAQQILLRDILRPNANRKPLHDLGEIAGGVVRRR